MRYYNNRIQVNIDCSAAVVNLLLIGIPCGDIYVDMTCKPTSDPRMKTWTCYNTHVRLYDHQQLRLRIAQQLTRITS